jgi:N-acetylated-alpha-linked acidic dipeptidase
VNEAIRYGTEAETNEELSDLIARFVAAAKALDTARAVLETPAPK